MRLYLARRPAMCVVVACLTLTSAPGVRPQQTPKTTTDEKHATEEPASGLALGMLSHAMTIAAASGAEAPRAMWAYDCAEQADHTSMLADDVEGSNVSGALPGETVGEVGRRHFQDLLGDWKVEIWSLESIDKRIHATGTAQVIQGDSDSIRIVYSRIGETSDDDGLSGSSLLRYRPGRGFALENRFGAAGTTAHFIGEFLAQRNAYLFYRTVGPDHDATDVIHSDVRIELRLASAKLWVAETYTFIDGKEVQVQAYRFERR